MKTRNEMDRQELEKRDRELRYLRSLPGNEAPWKCYKWYEAKVDEKKH